MGIAFGAFDSVGYRGTLGTNYPFQWTINGPSTNSQTPTTLPNGQTATMENLFAGIAMQDPTLVNGVGLGLVGKAIRSRPDMWRPRAGIWIPWDLTTPPR